MANVVEILVKASDETDAGFGAAKASAVASADEIAAAQDKVTAAEAKLRDAQIRQTDAQLKLEELQQSGKASAEELAAAQDKVTQATIRAADAQIRLGEADAALAGKEALAGNAATVQAEKVSLASRAAAGLKGAFAGLGQVGSLADLAIAGVGYEAVKMSMNFQAAMERLVTQAGVPQKELPQLKAAVLSLAGAVGFDPNSLAVSLYHVASNMQSMGATVPQMMNAVRIAAEGARVGGASLEDVTNALTAAIASGIPGVQNYTQAMGALNAIVGAGDMKMQDLAEAMGTGVLATVKGYGLSLKDVGAALATFGDNNIRGAVAATDLRMAVQALAVPAAAGKKALEGMGLSMSSLAADMRSGGLLKALEDLQAHFKKAGVTAQEQGDLITQIFGKKAGTGLNVLMDQLDRVRSKYPDITKGADSFGEAWKKTGQTLSQQWAQIRGTFDALLVTLGDKLIPVLSSVAGFLQKHEAIIKSLAPVVMAVVGAFAALKLVMAGISLVTSLGPVGLAIMAIVAATVLLIQHWKQVKQVAGEVWGSIYGTIVAPVVRAFNDVKAFIASNFDAWWKSHGEQVKQVWHVIWAVIMADWKIVQAEFKVGMAVLEGIFKVAWAAISAVFKVAWAVITGVVKIALALIKTEIKVTWDIIVGIFNVFLDLITGHWSKAWHDMLAAARQIGNAILSFLRSLIGDVFQIGKAIIQGLINGVLSMLGAVGSAAASVGHAVVSGFKSVLHIFSPSRVMFEHGQMVGQGLIDGMGSMTGAVSQAAGRLAEAVGDGIRRDPHIRHLLHLEHLAHLASMSGPSGAGGGYGGYGGALAPGVVVQLTVGTGSGLDQVFLAWLRQQIRVKGGNVQLVLGHG